jgi:hypothetical protein
MTAKLSEALALVGTIDPHALAGAATIYSDIVDMGQIRRALISVLEGAAVTTKMAGVAATISVFECTAAGTAASTALKSATITRAQTTAAKGQQAVLEVRDTELGDVHAAYTRYFKVGITAGTNAVNIGAVILGGDNRYSNAASEDLDTATVS